jgi:hypothetical protein
VHVDARGIEPSSRVVGGQSPDNRRFMQPTPDSRTKQLRLAELNVKRTSTIAARGHCIWPHCLGGSRSDDIGKLQRQHGSEVDAAEQLDLPEKHRASHVLHRPSKDTHSVYATLFIDIGGTLALPFST